MGAGDEVARSGFPHQILGGEEDVASVLPALKVKDDGPKEEGIDLSKGHLLSSDEFIAQHSELKPAFDQVFGCLLKEEDGEGRVIDTTKLPPNFSDFRDAYKILLDSVKPTGQNFVISTSRIYKGILTPRVYPFIPDLESAFTKIELALESKSINQINFLIDMNKVPKFIRQILAFYFNQIIDICWDRESQAEVPQRLDVESLKPKELIARQMKNRTPEQYQSDRDYPFADRKGVETFLPGHLKVAFCAQKIIDLLLSAIKNGGSEYVLENKLTVKENYDQFYQLVKNWFRTWQEYGRDKSSMRQKAQEVVSQLPNWCDRQRLMIDLGLDMFSESKRGGFLRQIWSGGGAS